MFIWREKKWNTPDERKARVAWMKQRAESWKVERLTNIVKEQDKAISWAKDLLRQLSNTKSITKDKALKDKLLWEIAKQKEVIAQMLWKKSELKDNLSGAKSEEKAIKAKEKEKAKAQKEREKEAKRKERDAKQKEKEKAKAEKEKVKQKRDKIKEEISSIQSEIARLNIKASDAKDKWAKEKIKNEINRKKEEILAKKEWFKNLSENDSDFVELYDDWSFEYDSCIDLLDEVAKEKKYWRPMTKYEERVNFEAIEKEMDKWEDETKKKLWEIIDKQRRDLANQITEILKSWDPKKLDTLTIKYQNEYSKAIGETYKKLFEEGKRRAADEIKVPAPWNNKEVKDFIEQKIKYSTDVHQENILKQIKAPILEKLKNKIQLSDLDDAMDILFNTDELSDTVEDIISATVVAESFNTWRDLVFKANDDQIYGYEYSALMDSDTCDYCASLDWRVVEPNSPEFEQYSPIQHFNCRCIWVAILKDEEEPPEFTGVPNSIPPSTLSTFKNLTTIIPLKTNKSAVNMAKKELERLERDTERYEENEIYEDRVKTNKKKIKQLKRSVWLSDEQQDALKDFISEINSLNLND